MPKWYKYLIVIAIAIFVICIIADILWIEKEPSTKIEIEAEVIKEPVGRMERIAGIGGGLFFYGIAALVAVLYFRILKCTGAGLGRFLFCFLTLSGLATYCLLIGIGFI